MLDFAIIYIYIYIHTNIQEGETNGNFKSIYLNIYKYLRFSFDSPWCVCVCVYIYIYISLNVKQTHYRPGHSQSALAVWGSQISRQSVHEGGKVVSPTHRPPLTPPQEIFLVLISVEGWINKRPLCGRKIMSMKNSNDAIGNRTRDVPACSAVPPRRSGQIKLQTFCRFN